MGELRWNDLEEHPRRNQPGETKAFTGPAPAPSGGEDRRNRDERAWPEARHRDHEIVAGRRAVRLLAAEELRQDVLGERRTVEIPVRSHADGDRPRADDRRQEQKAGSHSQVTEPTPSGSAAGP